MNYVYDSANRLTSVGAQSYTWDNNGNLTNDGASAYTYDSANRLKQVVQGGVTYTFSYNGQGDRVRQAINGTPTRYVLDLNAPLTQILADGSNTYLYGSTRIGEQQASGFAYHLPDALGSLRQLTTANASVTLTRAYEPFGSVTSATGSGNSIFGYAGEAKDATGLIFLRARFYNPTIGRFFVRDTWPGSYQMPGTLHPYLYGLNNPILYTDPSGRCADPLTYFLCAAAGIAIGTGIGFIGGAVVGAASSAINQAVTNGAVDWNQVRNDAAATAVVGAVGGFVYSATLVTGGVAAAALFGTSSASVGASVVGFGIVATAGVTSGIATRGTANLINGDPVTKNLVSWKQAGIDALLSVGLFWGGGRVANKIGARFGLNLNLGNFNSICLPPSAASAVRNAVRPVAGANSSSLGIGGTAPLARQLQAALDPGTQGRITLAVGLAKDTHGRLVILIGTSERNSYMRPSIRHLVDTLKGQGAIVVPGTFHAEENIVRYAVENNLKLIEVSAGRPICEPCETLIRAAGAIPGSATRSGSVP